MKSAREKAFSKRLMETIGHLDFYTPSLQLRAIHKGKKVLDLSFGEHYTYYDMASLTKILFTAPLWMQIVERSHLKLEDEVTTYLPWWQTKRRVLIKELLSHSGGMEWWQPFYKKIGMDLKPQEGFAKLKNLMRTIQPTSSFKAVYSDLDLFFLGAVSEELFQKSLFEQWKDLQSLFNFKSLNFNVQNKLRKEESLYAPTEFCPWRGYRLQGQVHDENAFALGGVAPHAGLFGTMEDLEIYVKALREETLCRPETLNMFVTRKMPKALGDFGYLYMKPTKGRASCGSYFEDDAYGHTGFTGTSIWRSPKMDLSVMILSNRVYLGREVELFANLRPKLHDLVVETLGLR